MGLNYNRPPAPIALIYEFDYGEEAHDGAGEAIPGSDVTYSVCSVIWEQDLADENDEGRWAPDLERVHEEFVHLKDAQALVRHLERVTVKPIV